MLTGKRLSYLLISGLLLLLIACSSSNEIKPADSVASLEQALKDAGMRVEGPNENDFLSARFFSIPGVQFNASGETVLAYEFSNETELMEQKDLVSPDGWGIGSKYIQWTTAPSYFQNGSLIVIYDGDKSLVMDTLTTAMGERFAGTDPA